MNAVISGRAGVAILLQGDQLLSMDFDKPEALVPRRPDEYYLLIAEGTDLEFLEDVNPTAIRQRLEHSVCREEALDVCLLLLDGGLADAIRTQAALDLKECLAAQWATDSLEAVLYAAPLPESADLPGALRCAMNQDQSVLSLLQRLHDQQPAIRTVHRLWEALPEHFFGGADERRHAMTICLRAGLFRDTALSLAPPGRPDLVVEQALNARPELRRFREALTRWGEILSERHSDAGLRPEIININEYLRPSARIKLVFTLEIDLNEFGPENQRDFLRNLESFGKLARFSSSGDEMKIVEIKRANSIKVSVILPEGAGDDLIRAIENRDPLFEAFLKPIVVSKIEVSEAKDPPKQLSEHGMPAQESTRTTQRVNVAVAGHTNSGKTTLIRTLMRAPIGEVGDEANKTKEAKAYYYDGLQANFIDTPGFNHASIVSFYLEQRKNVPSVKLSPEWNAKLKNDVEAMRGIGASQLVVYVANLSVVPDDGSREEIAAVRKIQPRVVGVLNQRWRQVKASSAEDVKNRIAQWQQVFKEQFVESVVVFDFHWDHPAKVEELYRSIHDNFAPECQAQFKEGLEQFNSRQAEIRREAGKMLSYLIKECQRPSLSVKRERLSEARAQLSKRLDESQAFFLKQVTELYRIAAENPSMSRENFTVKIKEEVIDATERLKSAAVAVPLFGGGGAAVGAGIGAGTGFLLAGVGAVAGAWLGGQIGAAIGAGVGGLAAFDNSSDTIAIQFRSDDLRDIAAAGLAALRGLSTVGFGRGTGLAAGEIEEIKVKILQSNLIVDPNTWTTQATCIC